MDLKQYVKNYRKDKPLQINIMIDTMDNSVKVQFGKQDEKQHKTLITRQCKTRTLQMTSEKKMLTKSHLGHYIHI